MKVKRQTFAEFQNHLQQCSVAVQQMPKVIRAAGRASMGLSQESCRYCQAPNESQCKCEGYAPHRVSAGEWIQPIRKGYLMECCDCSLVHRMDFRIHKGKIQFRAFRHEVSQ